MWWITDDEDFARRALGNEAPTSFQPISSSTPPRLVSIARKLVPRKALFSAQENNTLGVDNVLVFRAPQRSQFDTVCQLVRNGDEFSAAFIAGQSDHFRGHHGRRWSASLGNMHVTVLLTPNRTGGLAGPALVAIPSVAVCDVLDRSLVPTATIKWVNDVLLDDAKVAGVLTHSSFRGEQISAVAYGVGLNVESTPSIAKDPAVPQATSLAEYSPDARLSDYTAPVIRALCARTSQWARGEADSILSLYCERSAIVGRRVDIIEDKRPRDEHDRAPPDQPKVLRSGRVVRIDEHLSVYLDDNVDEPVRAGRILLHENEL